MTMSVPRISCWQANFSLEAEDHWLTKVSRELRTETIGTIGLCEGPNAGLHTFFVSEDSKQKVINSLGDFAQKILHPALRVQPHGVFVVLGIEGPPEDKLLVTLLKAAGRVTLEADLDKPIIDVRIQTPSTPDLSDLEKLIHTINALPEVKKLSGPFVAKVSLPLGEIVDVTRELPTKWLDPKDIQIANALLRFGYYDPNIKAGRITLERLARELKISKPTLIRRKKRLEALGLATMLLPRIPVEDMRMAAKALESMVHRKKSKT